MAISADGALAILVRRRVLSSTFTLVMKYVFPTIWILGFGLAVVAILLIRLQDQAHGNLQHPDDDLSAPEFFVIWLVGSVFLLYFGRRIKRIETDNTNLYISNFFQEVKVPLSNVEAVTENRWINQRPVSIYFRTPTSFGKSVMFIPRRRHFGFFSGHPVVLELRQLAAIQQPELMPAVALGSTARKIPGSNWMAMRLAGWDKANPKTFVTVNFVIGLLFTLSSSIMFFTDTSAIPPTILAVTRYVTLPICALLALSGLVGLAQPDARRGVLRLHGALLFAAALLLVTWMASIASAGLPLHTRFSWSPGFAELEVCYATFLFTRFTLRADAQRSAVIFYLPAWVLFPVIALDIGVMVRLGQAFYAAFSAQ